MTGLENAARFDLGRVRGAVNASIFLVIEDSKIHKALRRSAVTAY